jgi:hypothetical protein
VTRVLNPYLTSSDDEIISELLLHEYPFLYNYPGKGFLSDDLGHGKLLKGNDFGGLGGISMASPHRKLSFIAAKIFE